MNFICHVIFGTPNPIQELLRNVLGIKEHNPAELVKARITEKIPWLGSPELCVKQLYKGERWLVYFCLF